MVDDRSVVVDDRSVDVDDTPIASIRRNGVRGRSGSASARQAARAVVAPAGRTRRNGRPLGELVSAWHESGAGRPTDYRFVLAPSRTARSGAVFAESGNATAGRNEPFWPSPEATKSIFLLTKCTPVPTKGTPIPTKGTPIATKATPIPTKAMPVPTKGTPIAAKPEPTPNSRTSSFA